MLNDAILNAFKAFDTNDDGKISRDELGKVLTRSVPGGRPPLTRQESDEIFNDIDTDGSGYIEFGEFVAKVGCGDAPPLIEPHRDWAALDGPELETLLAYDHELGGSPVRLVDAEYIIKLAKGHMGGRFARRQDLPEEAFVGLQALKALPWIWHDVARVVILSHPWLQPDHPDPRGENLRLLAGALELLVNWARAEHGGGTLGVFVDFMSMHQKGPAGEPRTEKENAIFGRALSNLSTLYAHRRTWTLKVTKLPSDYPAAFTFPPGVTPNTAGYMQRGWCFTENCVSALDKCNASLVMDLGNTSVDGLASMNRMGAGQAAGTFVRQCMAGRSPPMTPDDFLVALGAKAFTNKKGDIEVVHELYKSAYEKKLLRATFISYNELNWDNADLAALMKVAHAGGLDSVRQLCIHCNQRITDLQPLIEALSAGKMTSLRYLTVDTKHRTSEPLKQAGRQRNVRLAVNSTIGGRARDEYI